MLLNINFTFFGSSVADCPSGVDMNFGRELNFKKAS